MRYRKPIGSLGLTVEWETVETRCVLARENRGTFLAVYVARVRVTVHADGSSSCVKATGTAEGRGTSPGEVHDVALRPLRPMQPNVPSRRSADPSGLNSIATRLRFRPTLAAANI
jgi:hypothetical protein